MSKTPRIWLPPKVKEESWGSWGGRGSWGRKFWNRSFSEELETSTKTSVLEGPGALVRSFIPISPPLRSDSRLEVLGETEELTPPASPLPQLPQLFPVSKREYPQSSL